MPPDQQEPVVALPLGLRQLVLMDQVKPEATHPLVGAMVVMEAMEHLELERTAQHLVAVAVELSAVAA